MSIREIRVQKKIFLIQIKFVEFVSKKNYENITINTWRST